MENLIIHSKIRIFDGASLRYVPTVGTTKIPNVGHLGSKILQYGQNIDNMMKIGTAIQQIANYKIISFLRPIDSFSVDISEAFRQKNAVQLLFQFSIGEKLLSDVVYLHVSVQEIDDYMPHVNTSTMSVNKNFPPAVNGFEKIIIKFDPEIETDISYGKTLPPEIVNSLMKNSKIRKVIKEINIIE